MGLESINASVNVDVDTLCVLAEAYNIPLNKCENITFSKIIPRMLDFFKKQKVQATFFVVGRYAEKKENKEIFSRMVSEEHELANHTMNHPPNFSKLSAVAKEKEIISCQKAIYETTGFKPKGFRAPGWDIDEISLKILEKNKLLYDSSIFPSSFMHFVPQVMHFFNRRKSAWESIGRKEFSSAPKEPYFPDSEKIWMMGKSNVLEIPVSTFSPFNIPFYATAFLASNPVFFNSAYLTVNNKKKYLNFQLHSVDFFDAKNELPIEIFSSLKHPSFGFSLEKKLAFFEKALNKINSDYEIVTLEKMARAYKND